MTEMHPADRTYRNQTVRVADLTVTNDVITRVTFENCVLVGPAVIVLMGGTSMQDSVWDGDSEAVLWPLGQREAVIGAVALVGCTIQSCRFQRIGLAYPAADEAMIRAGLGLG